MKKFAQRLRELRKEKNLSMKALAKQIGTSDVAINNWENEINEPKATYLYRLAKFFNVSIDYLIGLEDE
ncbi:MAG: helix-turn-helix transcriptional regulator [Clostridia bacterium]|nr:helix-turn-helix transcriptional regulator [Clostridia bacterium]